MRIIIIVIASAILLTSCAGVNHTAAINEIPEYGNINKSQSLIEADKEFIYQAQNQYGDSASEVYSSLGWQALRSGSPNIAIRRFNQSWLLDSNNYTPYWGFAASLGANNDFIGSAHYYEKAINKGGNENELNPEYAMALWGSENELNIRKAKEIFESEILKNNDKAACLYARAFAIDGDRDNACKMIKKCPNDLDKIAQKLKCGT